MKRSPVRVIVILAIVLAAANRDRPWQEITAWVTAYLALAFGVVALVSWLRRRSGQQAQR